MNRSIALVGVAVILGGLALVASPIVLYGGEVFTTPQEAGIFITPIGLLVIMIGAVQANPEITTVGGTFGNPDVRPGRPGGPRVPAPTAMARAGFSPREPADCRFCHSVIAWDLAFCPRCARPRECRSCGRPLGMAVDRTDCPGCHRAEAFCNCPRLARPRPASPSAPVRPRHG
jgi:hypothetical protein